MNKRIRKKQEKQRKQLEMKWLLDMAVAIDTAITAIHAIQQVIHPKAFNVL